MKVFLYGKLPLLAEGVLCNKDNMKEPNVKLARSISDGYDDDLSMLLIHTVNYGAKTCRPD